MKKKIFHTIRSTGQTFTQDEWAEYWRGVNNGWREPIRTQKGKYTFNEFDICLNPDKQTISAKSGAYGYEVTLSWAESGNGLWSYGLDYNLGTAGGGFGVSFADCTGKEHHHRNGYPTLNECKVAGWRESLGYIGNHENNARVSPANRLRQMIEDEIKSLTRPKYVQLELFA